MADEEDHRARQRSLFGCTRELNVPRTNNAADPARGGSRGYPLFLRERVVAFAEQVGVEETAARFGVSEPSVYPAG
jgi:hypothetical protein